VLNKNAIAKTTSRLKHLIDAAQAKFSRFIPVQKI